MLPRRRRGQGQRRRLEQGATIERIWNEGSVEGCSSHGSHGGRAQHACRLLVQGLVY